MGINLAFEVRAPQDAGEYAFRVLQSYGDGSVVEWTGAPDSGEPAAFVEVASTGGTGEGEDHGHGDEHHGDEEESGSHPADEPLPETGGGLSPALQLVSALLLAASAAALARAAVR